MLKEGRFSLGGFKPEGLLGRIEHHFCRIMGGQQAARRLAYSEQMLARAITCAFLEECGGQEKDGRWELGAIPICCDDIQGLLDDRESVLARVEALEQTFLRKDGDSDVERHEQRLLSVEASVERLRNDLPAPEQEKHSSSDQLEKLDQEVRSLIGSVRSIQNRLRKVEKQPASSVSAEGEF